MTAFTPEQLVTALVAEGVPEDAAKDAASRVDERMQACDPSAVPLGGELHEGVEADVDSIDKPGLLIWGEKDPTCRSNSPGAWRSARALTWCASGQPLVAPAVPEGSCRGAGAVVGT